MFATMRTDLTARLDEIREAGLYKGERVLRTPQSAEITVGDDQVLNLCANNYLGLADHPQVVEAAREALLQWGFGMASVRFICGTQEPHKLLEQRLSTSSAPRTPSCTDRASTPTVGCSRHCWAPRTP